MIDSPTFESWYESNAQDTPSRSVDRLFATVGIDMPTRRVAVPEKKVARRAVERSK
jgi:hypothetical protein